MRDHSHAIAMQMMPKDPEAAISEHLELAPPDNVLEEIDYSPQVLDGIGKLSKEHEQYLLERHGTVFLDPLPTQDPSQPLNWSDRKKAYHIFLLCTLTFSGTFMSAGISPAYNPMAEKYGKSVTDCSYLTTAQLICMGVLPIFFFPIMETYGRKPILIIASVFAFVTNLGGGFCKTYNQQMATRVLNSVCLSVGTSLGGAMIASMCFARERGRKNGLWSLSVILGTPLGPFICGWIVQRVGFRWVYFVFAIYNFLQIIGFIFSDETLYIPNAEKYLHTNKFMRFLGFRRNPNRTLNAKAFIAPVMPGSRKLILLAAIASTIVFGYANIVFIIETPSIFVPLYHLNAEQLALQYIPMIIGCLVGEAIGGAGSDFWMQMQIKRRNGVRVPSDRIYVSYLGFVCCCVGIIIWGVFLTKSTEGVWNVKPLIGSGIATAGADIVLTTLIAYCIDLEPWDADNIAIFLMLLRLILGFVSPFYFPYMFANLGYAKSGELMCGLMVGAGLIAIYVQIISTRKTVLESKREGA